jgi:hypothetical protein
MDSNDAVSDDDDKTDTDGLEDAVPEDDGDDDTQDSYNTTQRQLAFQRAQALAEKKVASKAVLESLEKVDLETLMDDCRCKCPIYAIDATS